MPSKRPLLATPPSSKRSAWRAMGFLTAGVLAVHLILLLSLTGTLEWRLKSDESARVAPLQTRWIAAPPVTSPGASATTKSTPEKARTRIATEAAKPSPAPASAANARPLTDAASSTPTPETEARAAQVTEPPVQELPTQQPLTAPAAATAAAPASGTESGSVMPAGSTPAHSGASGTNSVAHSVPNLAPPSPEAATAPTLTLPPMALGALPPSVLLSYRLTGQEKGLTYHASGELRWQHHETAYAMSLSVKAFLIGSRHWRSQGEITSAGLAPTRFSDSWRNERAAHFDRVNHRVVFSSNAPVAALEPGAQDQISLYAQLAAAMAAEPQRFQPGTRLQVQTATVRDALPWLLTLAPAETLQVEGKDLQVAKWVCQPRNRFDATVAFWVSPQHGWMPVRIRITQISGSYIDLVLTGQERLPPLPKS